MVERFSGRNWEEKVLKSPKPVFVDFVLPQRPSFLMQSPELMDFQRQWNGIAEVGYLDVASDFALAMKYPIVDLPTLSLFLEGKILKSSVGSSRFHQNFLELMTRHPPFASIQSMTWIIGGRGF